MDYLAGNGEYADRERFPLPGLALLDLKLPRVTGLEVLKWVHEQPELNNLVVLILSSSQVGHDIDMAYQLGAKAFLVKPSSPKELREIAAGIKRFWLDENPGPSRRLNRPRPSSRSNVFELNWANSGWGKHPIASSRQFVIVSSRYGDRLYSRNVVFVSIAVVVLTHYHGFSFVARASED